jgi:hypothetical protein
MELITGTVITAFIITGKDFTILLEKDFRAHFFGGIASILSRLIVLLKK